LIFSFGLTNILVGDEGVSEESIRVISEAQGFLREIIADSKNVNEDDSGFSWLKLILLPVFIIFLVLAFIAVIQNLNNVLNNKG
jgi:hypothetical protein